MEVRAVNQAVLILPEGTKPTLKQLLKLNNWSNKKMAAFMGISPSAASSWVTGFRHPNIEQAIKLGQTFGLSVESIDWWPERRKV